MIQKQQTLFSIIVTMGMGLLFFSAPICGYQSYDEVQDTGLESTIQGMRAFQVHYQNWMFYTLNTHTPGYIETAVYNTRTKVNGKTEIDIRPFYRWRAGPVVETNRPLDFYIDAKSRGFFQVRLPSNKIAVTRDGRFDIDAQNRLVTMAGQYPVLGKDGDIILGEGDISVSRSGLIFLGNTAVAQLDIAVFRSFNDMQSLESLNGSFFVETKTLPRVEGPEHYVIQQGYLEQNNVLKAINGDILLAKNGYDATVKVAHILNKALGTAASISAP